MTKQRRFSGDETYETLLNWRKGQKASERLAASILKIESYSDIDPSHPLGGRDGKKDLICRKGEKNFIVGVYFPRGEKTYKEVQKKFLLDCEGILKNKVDGLTFFTNQYLTLGNRKKLIKASGNDNISIFHLEKITSILNCPAGYGIRLEFLDIQLSKEEQLSYFAHKEKDLTSIQKKLSEILTALDEKDGFRNISKSKLTEFKTTLKTIVGDRNSIFSFGNSMIDRLHIPLKELHEFRDILYEITESSNIYYNDPIRKLNVPLQNIKKFREILYEIIGKDNISLSPLNKLQVPLKDLEEYNSNLDKTINKLKKIEEIKDRTK